MRILVVEDEPRIASLAVRILAHAGHEGEAAATGAQAIAMLRDQSVAVDVVVVDRGLPDMSGDDVIREARASRPEAAVVLSSGGRCEDAPACDALLQKPYGPAHFVDAIKAALAARTVRRLHKTRRTTASGSAATAR
jgi:DNA-binding response OmpR family regulator